LSSIHTERRAHHRIETDLQIQGSPEHGDIVARMTASNLSLGGLQCTSASGFPEMTRLAVRLMLPAAHADESAPLEDARYTLALFFTRLDDIARERLTQFIEA